MKIALIGYGYWGKKIYQTLSSFISNENIFVVDPNIKDSNLTIKLKKIENILSRKDIEHILIATPEETHYEIALKCLKNKKNIFVEKPFCLKAHEASHLHQLAQENNLQIFVDYVFLYDPYVKKIKKIIQENKLGNLLKIESIRHSANINKPNISVSDDLAIHDIYLGEYFFEKKISKTKINKKTIMLKHAKEAKVVFYYDKKTLSADYSWIQPTSKRIMTFIGSAATLVWDKDEKKLLIYKNQKLTNKMEVEKNKSPLELSVKEFLFGKSNYNYRQDIEILEKINYS
ncbi:MAG: Gfo/Idh/MocA family oxidoreductase [Candidatus Pacebacteria bacterium]|nr:Gfo/Idh/MocA family oxidoreductase [Candidatus Paceibacterota bacterium]